MSMTDLLLVYIILCYATFEDFRGLIEPSHPEGLPLLYYNHNYN